MPPSLAFLGCPVVLGSGGRPAELNAQGRMGTVLGAETLTTGLSAVAVFLVAFPGPGGYQVRTFAEDELIFPTLPAATPPVTAAAHERPPPAAPGAPASK